MHKVIIGLLALAIVLIGGNIVSAIMATIPQGGPTTLLIVGLSAAAIIDIIAIIVYMLKGK